MPAMHEWDYPKTMGCIWGHRPNAVGVCEKCHKTLSHADGLFLPDRRDTKETN